MDERLNLKAVDDYSDDYTSKVTASFFSQKEKITGPEVLKLCSIHQVNLFAIRELLGAWRLEGQKFRSPYFDYSSPEVTDALNRLQNALSNNISISRENFQPILKKAVSLTLYLILDPYDFFSDTLDRQGSTHVRTSDLRNEIKYVKINRPPLERLVQRLEEKKLETIPGKEAFGLLDQILEEVNFTPEDVEEYIANFSQVAPLALEKLYEKKLPVAEKKPEPAVAVKKQELPIGAEIKSKPTLADNFQKIARIKDSLTINQKFMFTKILFKGDFEVFSRAIEKLDRCENLNQAMHFLGQNYPEWDRESEECEEFIDLVEKRFLN